MSVEISKKNHSRNTGVFRKTLEVVVPTTLLFAAAGAEVHATWPDAVTDTNQARHTQTIPSWLDHQYGSLSARDVTLPRSSPRAVPSLRPPTEFTLVKSEQRTNFPLTESGMLGSMLIGFLPDSNKRFNMKAAVTLVTLMGLTTACVTPGVQTIIQATHPTEASPVQGTEAPIVIPNATNVPSTEAPTVAPAEAQWFTKTETDATGKEWTIVPGPDGSPVDAESLTNGTTINLVRRSMLTNDVLTDVPPTADNFIQYSFYRMKGVTDQPFSHITENNDSYVQAYAPGDKNAIDYGNNWPSLDENIIWNLAVRWKHPAVDFANFPAYSTANGNTLAPDVNQLVKDLANNKVILPIDLPGGTKYYNAHDATIIQVPMASLASDPEAFGSFLKFKYAVVDGGDSQANPGKLVIYEAVPAGYLNPEKTDVTLFGPYYYALMDRSLANADSADFITDDMSLPRRHGSTLTAAAFSDLQSQIEYHAMYGDAYNGKPAFWTTSK